MGNAATYGARRESAFALCIADCYLHLLRATRSAMESVSSQPWPLAFLGDLQNNARRLLRIVLAGPPGGAGSPRLACAKGEVAGSEHVRDLRVGASVRYREYDSDSGNRVVTVQVKSLRCWGVEDNGVLALFSSHRWNRIFGVRAAGAAPSRMAEGTRVANKDCRNSDGLRTRCTDSPDLGPARTGDSVLGRTLVPGAACVLLGVPQLWRKIGDHQHGRGDSGDGVYVSGLGLPVARCRRRFAAGIDSCLHNNCWSRKGTCDCRCNHSLPCNLRRLQSCRCTAAGA